MYKIIGGDGREYGPITKEQLHQWIAEGRADAATRVRPEGSNDWKTLSSLPEFSGAFATIAIPSANPPPPLAAGARPAVGGPGQLPQKTSGFAIASLVLGLLGFLCSMLTAIPGFVLGIIGLVKIKRSNGALTGSGLAISGIVVSVIALTVNSILVYHVFMATKKAIHNVQSAFTNMPQYSIEADRCLGERMAEETSRLINGEGEVVVLSMAGGKYKNVVADAQLEGFKNGLESHEGVHLVAVQDPSKQQLSEMFKGVSEESFLNAISNHPNAKAIVSFMGLPNLAKEGSKVNTETLPKVVALHQLGTEQWKQLVSNGVVSAVILPRYDVRWDKLSKAGDCQTLFDSRYHMVTQDNYTEMAEKLKQFYPTP